VREGDDDRYHSGTGERVDDESYERYLNRGWTLEGGKGTQSPRKGALSFNKLNKFI
jgi:hypothetical protein